MTAGGTGALQGYSNRGDADLDETTDLPTAFADGDLAVCVTLKDDLPGQAAEGSVCRTRSINRGQGAAGWLRIRGRGCCTMATDMELGK